MGLKEYKEKRNFSKTIEPKGKVKKQKKGKLRFIIQKHHASHLHYDFRLELDGVLKSWAIPKGPSMDSKVKRLAMMVEDHPIEYGNFEGIIPKGNYGAGTVMLWDQGFYKAKGLEGKESNEKELERMLHAGNLKFILEGEKLKGEFVLVKTQRKGGKGNEWLLIKKQDEFSSSDTEVTEQNLSVVTGRSLEEIKNNSNEKSSQWHSPDLKNINLNDTFKSKMPSAFSPMLATLADKSFNDKGWIFEIKWDGFRAIGKVNYNEAQLFSRNNLSFADSFPDIIDKLLQLGIQAIFDGEVVVLDENGKSDFQLIQNYKRTGKGQLAYYIFDILYLNGHDLSQLPLTERKDILKTILPEDPILRYSDHINEIGKDFFDSAAEQGLEGIIAKKANSIYQPGKRVKDWLKIKITQEQEAIIVGYTYPRGSRKKFGALILAVKNEGELKYIGHSGGGFNDQTLQELYEKLKPLERKSAPFKDPPKTNMPVKWVEPKLICQVKFQEWTSEGIMRQPIFLGLREDKKPEDVIKENPVIIQKVTPIQKQTVAPMRTAVKRNKKSDKRKTTDISLLDSAQRVNKGKDAILIFGEIEIKISNLNKVLWPKEGYTKKDLVDYYDRISEVILPYLKDRPESLRRSPNGIEGKDFFQKNMPSSIPEWMKTKPVFSESNDADVNYLICNDKPTLLYMANLGCIELNPWSSRLENLDKPDFTVLDLDPNGATFDEVKEVALTVKEVLDRINIKAYPKTSGSRGIHIYIPLGAQYTYDQAKDFTLILAKLVNKMLPELTTIERTPAKRKSPIYLDYLQNRKGQTLAAPYCLRPKPGATVSTPVLWDELAGDIHPGLFTINTIFSRLEEVGDLFLPVLGPGINMEKALEKLINL